MATFTSPKTYSTGDVLTASDMNTYQRDNITHLNDDVQDTIESAQFATVSTSETSASTSYANLATSGPAVTATVRASGMVLIGISSRLRTDSASGVTHMSYAVSGATTSAANDGRALSIESSNASDVLHATFSEVRTSLNAGSTTFTAKYRVTAGTGTWDQRDLWVIPL